MKLFLYFHDAALTHSRYLLEGFAAHPRVNSLTVAYPQGRGADIIFSAGSADTNKPANYQMVGLKSGRLRAKWARFSALMGAIRDAQPDYVIVLDEALYPNTLLAGLAVRLLKVNAPVVFYGFENIHQSPPWDWLFKNGYKAFWPFLRKTLRYYVSDRGLQPIRRRVISGGLVSYSECEAIVHQAGWQTPMREQWWGVDTGLFKAAAEKRVGRPAAWHASDSQRVIGFVGRFVPEKGVVDLLQALAMLGPDFLLVCVGGGPQEVELWQTAKGLCVEQQLRIFPPMPASALAEHIAAMDVLALPSHTEQFWKEQYGRVLVEAMAAGVPVIGSDSGAIPYVLGDAQRTFAEKDIAGICSAVKVALAMTAKARAQQQVRAQRGDVSAFVDGYIRFYDELLDKC